MAIVVYSTASIHFHIDHVLIAGGGFLDMQYPHPDHGQHWNSAQNHSSHIVRGRTLHVVRRGDAVAVPSSEGLYISSGRAMPLPEAGLSRHLRHGYSQNQAELRRRLRQGYAAALCRAMPPPRAGLRRCRQGYDATSGWAMPLPQAGLRCHLRQGYASASGRAMPPL
jgi:hypothetical protein